MNIQVIDFRKLAALIIPPTLRQTKIVSILLSLIAPLRELSDQRDTLRVKTMTELQYNGQVCYLRTALNKLFGKSREDGFEVQTIEGNGEYVMIYDETDYLSMRHPILKREPDILTIYGEDQIIIAYDFVVYCPTDVFFEKKSKMPQVRKIVEKYRLCSRLPNFKDKTDYEFS